MLLHTSYGLASVCVLAVRILLISIILIHTLTNGATALSSVSASPQNHYKHQHLERERERVRVLECALDLGNAKYYPQITHLNSTETSSSNYKEWPWAPKWPQHMLTYWHGVIGTYPSMARTSIHTTMEKIH